LALVIFRSRAAAEIIMFSHDANLLLEILGKMPGERGVITASDTEHAIRLLEQAVHAHSDTAGADQATDDAAAPVALRQRAYPLLQMLIAAHRKQVDVTWGV
jgi:hypothetical protein